MWIRFNHPTNITNGIVEKLSFFQWPKSRYRLFTIVFSVGELPVDKKCEFTRLPCVCVCERIFGERNLPGHFNGGSMGWISRKVRPRQEFTVTNNNGTWWVSKQWAGLFQTCRISNDNDDFHKVWWSRTWAIAKFLVNILPMKTSHLSISLAMTPPLGLPRYLWCLTMPLPVSKALAAGDSRDFPWPCLILITGG